MKKLLPRVWLTLLVVLSTAALLAVTSGIWPGIPVRNNIMELLPALRDDPVLLHALQRSNSGVSRKLLILVGDTDTKKTAEAAAIVEKIAADVRRILMDPEFRKTNVDAYSYVAVASTPTEHKAFLASALKVQGLYLIHTLT